VRFGGTSSVTIPAGGEVVSDPVPIQVSSGTQIAVSTYVPGAITKFTYHELGGAVNYCTGFDGGGGDQTAATSTTTWPVRGTAVSWLNGIDVTATTSEKSIVTLGDSLTDGFPVEADQYHRYPDRLSARLQATSAGSHVSVINMGIGGNAIYGGVGPAAIARFDHDVLAQAGVRHLVLFEGTNDIGGGATAQSIIDGLTGLINRAHAANVAVTLATITPRHNGCGQPNDAVDNVIDAVNSWVRSTTSVESKVDFAAAVRDPSSTNCIRPSYDSGDHLHFSAAGYQAMADAFDLRIFTANTGQVSAPSGLCLDLPGGASSNGTQAQVWNCLQNSPQSWTVLPDGTVRAYGKCLDISGNSTAVGVPVQVWTCNGLGGQVWKQQSNGELRNPQSNLCLDLPNGNAVNGQALRTWPCNGTFAQQFRLPTTS
jgi:lysophospholipase L1-like esterase